MVEGAKKVGVVRQKACNSYVYILYIFLVDVADKHSMLYIKKWELVTGNLALAKNGIRGI